MPEQDRVARHYRVGSHYGIHVYDGDRPVATFHDAEEAAEFVRCMSERAELLRRVGAAEEQRLDVLAGVEFWKRKAEAAERAGAVKEPPVT